MGRYEYVDHLMNHDVLQQIPRFLDQLRIQTNGPLFRVAASPFGVPVPVLQRVPLRNMSDFNMLRHA